jgi:hypothetical protein
LKQAAWFLRSLGRYTRATIATVVNAVDLSRRKQVMNGIGSLDVRRVVCALDDRMSARRNGPVRLERLEQTRSHPFQI